MDCIRCECKGRVCNASLHECLVLDKFKCAVCTLCIQCMYLQHVGLCHGALCGDKVVLWCPLLCADVHSSAFCGLLKLGGSGHS